MNEEKRAVDKRKSSAPIVFYAVVLGVLVVAATIFGSQYGRANQNPIAPATKAPSASH